MVPRPPGTRDGTRTPAGDSSPESPEEVARAVVLRQLGFGPRTRAQLRDKVLARDVPAEVAERVLDRFAEVRLVDDAQFAADWVRIRHRDRGLSRRALADELRRKGVEPEDAEPALATLDGDDERAAAEALVARKLPASRGVDYPKRVNRLLGMLARKGYSPALAGDVVRTALAAEGQDDARPDVD